MAKKMRTMTHNSRTNSKGRVHGSKHNDRNFDVDQAANIDKSRVDQNYYWHCFQNKHPEWTFEQVELHAYKRLFSKQLQETNEKYIANRHPERCKTMEQFIKLKQYCPEETVLQVGKMEEHIDRATLQKIHVDYMKRMLGWCKEHGNPFQLLDIAIHADEAVPHIQQRRVWYYTDQNGIVKVGQEKALEQAGVPLPDPDKPEGRRNNRKMTFDKMARDLWIEVCHDHGVEVEREPVPDGKHNREKEDMIRDKYSELSQELSAMKEKVDDLTEQKRALESEIEGLENDITSKKDELEDISKAVSGIVEDMKSTSSWSQVEARMERDRVDQQKEKRLDQLERFITFLKEMIPDFFQELWDRFMQHERDREGSRSKKKMLNQDRPL